MSADYTQEKLWQAVECLDRLWSVFKNASSSQPCYLILSRQHERRLGVQGRFGRANPIRPLSLSV